eukprot:m.353335 g.353335  ORF g.353335 m.353335 type:complete len:458 (+) comp16592_c0_seq12:129-1502(+)
MDRSASEVLLGSVQARLFAGSLRVGQSARFVDVAIPSALAGVHWSPGAHRFCGSLARERVLALMLVARRLADRNRGVPEERQLPSLPTEMWTHILSMLSRDVLDTNESTDSPTGRWLSVSSDQPFDSEVAIITRAPPGKAPQLSHGTFFGKNHDELWVGRGLYALLSGGQLANMDYDSLSGDPWHELTLDIRDLESDHFGSSEKRRRMDEINPHDDDFELSGDEGLILRYKFSMPHAKGMYAEDDNPKRTAKIIGIDGDFNAIVWVAYFAETKQPPGTFANIPNGSPVSYLMVIDRHSNVRCVDLWECYAWRPITELASDVPAQPTEAKSDSAFPPLHGGLFGSTLLLYSSTDPKLGWESRNNGYKDYPTDYHCAGPRIHPGITKGVVLLGGMASVAEAFPVAPAVKAAVAAGAVLGEGTATVTEAVAVAPVKPSAADAPSADDAPEEDDLYFQLFD